MALMYKRGLATNQRAVYIYVRTQPAEESKREPCSFCDVLVRQHLLAGWLAGKILHLDSMCNKKSRVKPFIISTGL